MTFSAVGGTGRIPAKTAGSGTAMLAGGMGTLDGLIGSCSCGGDIMGTAATGATGR